MWVMARQYTGRVVTVTNDKIFDEPVYNYSREFPYLWEEMRLGISYLADRNLAEHILLDVANRHTIHVQELNAISRRWNAARISRSFQRFALIPHKHSCLRSR